MAIFDILTESEPSESRSYCDLRELLVCNISECGAIYESRGLGDEPYPIVFYGDEIPARTCGRCGTRATPIPVPVLYTECEPSARYCACRERRSTLGE